MAHDRAPETVTNVSNEAVLKATGKPWAEWMTVLDNAGGRKMNHKQLVAILAANDEVSAWWQQGIAVTYEKSRGLRETHQRDDSYEISRSRTMNATAERVYNAWVSEATRARWLPDTTPALRKATGNKTIYLNWTDGTLVEVRLSDKGDRTQVVVQHSKLADGDTAERMKAYWSEALDRLKELVEAGL